jgi:hypothetical protein
VARVPLPSPVGTFATTIWTPIGLAGLVLLLLVLGAREFTRIWRPENSRIARRLATATIPLLVFFVIVVIIRFVVLG